MYHIRRHQNRLTKAPYFTHYICTLGGQVTRSGLHPLRQLKERNCKYFKYTTASLFDKHVSVQLENEPPTLRFAQAVKIKKIP